MWCSLRRSLNSWKLGLSVILFKYNVPKRLWRILELHEASVPRQHSWLRVLGVLQEDRWEESWYAD
jgi:hypothetical protein